MQIAANGLGLASDSNPDSEPAFQIRMSIVSFSQKTISLFDLLKMDSFMV